jgi:biopolymer transport protein ExbD
MKFFHRHRARPEVPIVPLIDILTILLIFFIVTTTFKKKDEERPETEEPGQKNEALLSITLPKASNLDVALNPGERLTLGLTPEGDVFLEDAKVELDELAPILRGLKMERPDTKLELRADENVPFGLVIKVWNTLAEAGIKVNEVPSRILIKPEEEIVPEPPGGGEIPGTGE